jgi:Protein of unknown function (DUF2950)
MKCSTMLERVPGFRSMRRSGGAIALGLLGLFAAGCKSNAADDRQTFGSPEAAVDALVAAFRSHDHARLLEVLGPEGEEIVSSGDSVIDRHDADTFLAAYDLSHDIRVEDEDRATLLVGKNDWPLPIPIVRDDGSWWFDTAEGKEEILARRIGRNELAAILVCRAIVDAQHEFAESTPRQDGAQPAYAQKFLSDSGKHDGLYWETRDGEPESPLGALVAEASARGYETPTEASQGRPFHGYHYRMLTAQGSDAPGGARSYLEGGRMTKGFGVVAWPSAYENSGIMTFITCHDGIVYQKDLGEETPKVARDMKSFDPGDGWEIVP